MLHKFAVHILMRAKCQNTVYHVSGSKNWSKRRKKNGQDEYEQREIDMNQSNQCANFNVRYLGFCDESMVENI